MDGILSLEFMESGEELGLGSVIQRGLDWILTGLCGGFPGTHQYIYMMFLILCRALVNISSVSFRFYLPLFKYLN